MVEVNELAPQVLDQRVPAGDFELAYTWDGVARALIRQIEADETLVFTRSQGRMATDWARDADRVVRACRVIRERLPHVRRVAALFREEWIGSTPTSGPGTDDADAWRALNEHLHAVVPVVFRIRAPDAAARHAQAKLHALLGYTFVLLRGWDGHPVLTPPEQTDLAG